MECMDRNSPSVSHLCIQQSCTELIQHVLGNLKSASEAYVTSSIRQDLCPMALILRQKNCCSKWVKSKNHLNQARLQLRLCGLPQRTLALGAS